MYRIGFQEVEQEENVPKKIFEEMNAKKCPKFMKDLNSQIPDKKKMQQISNRINTKSNIQKPNINIKADT